MGHFQRTTRFLKLSAQGRILATVVGCLTLLLAATVGSVSAASATHIAGTTPISMSAQQVVSTQGKSPEVHNAYWLSLKLAHKISTPGGLNAPKRKVSPYVYACPSSPCSYSLDTSVVQNTLEPYGNYPGNNSACVNDDNGNCYIDRYYWNYCGAGAVDSALYYWNGKTNTYPAGYYTEPSYANYRKTTYWTSGDHNRSYLMYIAESTLVPGWSTAGMVTFNSYPSAGAYLGDVTNTLNWEASNHNTSTWQNYYYATVSDSGLSSTTLNNDIVYDINRGYPVVAEVNTTNLPNWNTNGIIHYVTIVGYDNIHGTYTYVDSCGTACGSMGSGVHTINQTAPDQYGNDMLAAITNVGSGGGFSW